jgi:hypothetical protein
MFFIKSALKALEKPDKPFIHNVIPAGRSRWETCFPAIALDALNWGSSCLCVVEPDGIEPTTSCLQSTRSTN